MKEIMLIIIFFIGIAIGYFGGTYDQKNIDRKNFKLNTTDTIIDNGDVWYSLQDSTNKIEWRHIRSSDDSVSVIHIHQGDSLYTWIGKPCNCY